MPFWRGLFLGFFLATGLVGFGLYYTVSRGVTVTVDQGMVARAVGAQVEAQARFFLPEMLAGFKEQLTAQVTREMAKNNNMEIAFGSLQIPLPPQTTRQIDQYVVQAVQQTLVVYLQSLNTEQLVARMGQIAGTQARAILARKLVGQTLSFRPYTWLTVPIHVVVQNGAGGSGGDILPAGKGWPRDLAKKSP